MTFNETLYTQKTFRKLLDCMARPGKINRIEGALLNLNFSWTYYTLGCAITLMDQEVSFHILGNDSNCSSELSIYTGSREDDIKNCDYLIMNGNSDVDVSVLKRGTLEYPDESATVICEVTQLSNNLILSEDVVNFNLKGPGIKKRETFYINRLNNRTIESWQQSNMEFPLGLDWIFVDLAGHICCIPRSTLFTWEVI